MYSWSGAWAAGEAVESGTDRDGLALVRTIQQRDAVSEIAAIDVGRMLDEAHIVEPDLPGLLAHPELDARVVAVVFAWNVTVYCCQDGADVDGSG